MLQVSVNVSMGLGNWLCYDVARAHQLLSHDLTNVIYEVVTVQGGGR